MNLKAWGRIGGLFGLVVPWSIWLMCGLAHPFAIKDSVRRRLGFIALAWFALIFAFFSIWSAKQQRYILPIVPAAALLCAQVLGGYQRQADTGRKDVWGQRLGAAIWLCALGTSIIAGPFLAEQDWLIRAAERWYPNRRFEDVSWPWATALSMTLCAIAVLGWRWNAQWRPLRAGAALAAWTLTVISVYWLVDLGEPARTGQVLAFKQAAERVAGIVGQAPMRSLRLTPQERSAKLNEEFRLYSGRLIGRILPAEIVHFADQANGPAYILTAPHAESDRLLSAAGFQLVDDHVEVDERDIEQLWVHEH